MPLPIGARLGVYEILSAIGAGGMGEVYRAHDPRLRRDVAIKVLPSTFLSDAARLHRFEHEARAAAGLNHPNILAVHDIGAEGGAPFIVSELLEGVTLRERMRAGPVGVRKAVIYAIAIAQGLTAAHEKGIVHRDLKPENLFLTSDDRVKILDFGLAKLTCDACDPGDAIAASALPTVAPPTQPGAVLGTVGYMAPEQVRGQPADHRADLFALGAVVYELISGRRAFRRDTSPETMTAILNEDPPDLIATGQGVPPALARIVQRCLEKAPSARFQTASDLAFALEGLSDTSGPVNAVGAERRASRFGWIVAGAAALLLVAFGSFAIRWTREAPAAARSMRFQISPNVEFGGPGNFSLSPDGRYLAFFGLGPDGIPRVWIRAMDSTEVRSLSGSEVSGTTPPPFWSPDSRFIAFDVGGKLKKLDVTGGPSQTLGDLPSLAVGGTWNRDGDIIVGSLDGGLMRLRETGGSVSRITTLDPARKEEFHLFPTFLPDGRHFVYLRVSPTAPEAGGTYIGTLDAKAGEQSTNRLLPYEVGVTYVPAADSGLGHLLFLREGTLLAQSFDPQRLALLGAPVPVAEHVGSFRDGGFFSASANDRLVYRTADTDLQLAWFDRQGRMFGHLSDPGAYRSAALSPDGTRAVVSRTNPQDAAKSDLWLINLSNAGSATRLTFGTGASESPIWSPDGKRVVFTFNQNSLRQKLVSGEGDETVVLHVISGGVVVANAWSPDKRFLMYATIEKAPNKWDLLVLPPDGQKPVPFVRTEFDEDQGRFAPNGRSVAYVSNKSGAAEVYVRAFTDDFRSGSAGSGGSVLVSRGGGTAPRWRGDGRELFYLSTEGKMMAVEVSADQDFRAGTPTLLFQAPSGAIVGDVSADGKRFLLVTPVGAASTPPFTVILNWTAGLTK